jgi:hypothetical protein
MVLIGASGLTPSFFMTLYERNRQEHWLRDKQDEDKSLILNDDSVLEGDARNQFLTKRWLRGSTIVVEYTEEPGYLYLPEPHRRGSCAS